MTKSSSGRFLHADEAGAILGMSRSLLQPVVRDGQVVPRLMLPLSLTYDHRVVDGADGARFTSRLRSYLAIRYGC